jgi:hypothetical protein
VLPLKLGAIFFWDAINPYVQKAIMQINGTLQKGTKVTLVTYCMIAFSDSTTLGLSVAKI